MCVALDPVVVWMKLHFYAFNDIAKSKVLLDISVFIKRKKSVFWFYIFTYCNFWRTFLNIFLAIKLKS